MIQDLSVLDEVKICPHCKETLSCCEAPPIHIGDGLGWGSEVLFICLNDSCSLFLRGWDKIESQYGHHASYRYMELPGSKEANLMMVGNADAFKACVIDKATLEKQNKQFHKAKEAFQKLDSCAAERNLEPVLTLLLDESARKNWREAALEKLGEVNDLACVDPLRNHQFRDTNLQQKVNLEIAALLKTNFKKECPYCAELIKAQAKKCKHCKEDL
ncbi:MAG: zinc ribbon domain-containing protein [Desulforhopalus sp.]